LKVLTVVFAQGEEESAFFASDPQWLTQLRQLVSSGADLGPDETYGQQVSSEQQQAADEAQWKLYYEHQELLRQQQQQQQSETAEGDKLNKILEQSILFRSGSENGT
jgi:hypothetical protein